MIAVVGMANETNRLVSHIVSDDFSIIFYFKNKLLLNMFKFFKLKMKVWAGLVYFNLIFWFQVKMIKLMNGLVNL